MIIHPLNLILLISMLTMAFLACQSSSVDSLDREVEAIEREIAATETSGNQMEPTVTSNPKTVRPSVTSTQIPENQIPSSSALSSTTGTLTPMSTRGQEYTTSTPAFLATSITQPISTPTQVMEVTTSGNSTPTQIPVTVLELTPTFTAISQPSATPSPSATSEPTSSPVVTQLPTSSPAPVPTSPPILTKTPPPKPSGGSLGGGGRFGGGSTGQPMSTPASTPEIAATTTSTLTPMPTLSSFIVIEDKAGMVGEALEVPIRIEELDDGLSGYDIELSLEKPEIARILHVDVPPFGLTQVGELPSTSVTIKALDVSGLIDGVVVSEILATLSLELLSEGETQFQLNVISIDSDQGSDLRPYIGIEDGVLTVN